MENLLDGARTAIGAKNSEAGDETGLQNRKGNFAKIQGGLNHKSFHDRR